MTEEKKTKSKGISRRDFLKDAGLLVGGTAIGSTVLLAACGGDAETETVTSTKTVTSTAAGGTTTVTKTEQVGTATETVTQSVPSYVCPYDGQEFDSLSELKAHIEAEHTGESTSTLSTVKLTVNGKEYEVVTKPHWPLRDVLRNQLGITSVKDMCTGYGACGSCSVIMNDRPILSCMMLAIECDGADIITCEGISDSGDPLIEAYALNACMQCGFCTPGFVVTARALLNHNPNPTVDEINEALSGNLCRCDTYPAHVLAIQEVAGQ
ncbi:MAG: (2Fe-2S)-binding protein [Candidatus Bathyarchaeota archaeon]|nr:(2Fe-2S)-binding protein [Candidatus Bathyarchaeota archaeon]